MEKWQFKSHLVRHTKGLDGLMDVLKSGKLAELDQIGGEGWDLVDVNPIYQNDHIYGLLYTFKRERIDDK